MGPLATTAQVTKVMNSISAGRREGGTVVCGGHARPDLGLLFVEPTIFTGLGPDSSLMREEIFGPVLSVATFQDETEAIALANSTEFGLAGSVWTED